MIYKCVSFKSSSALIPDHTHTPSHTYYYCRRRDCAHIRLRRRLRRLRAETQKTYHELSSGIRIGRLPGHDIYVCVSFKSSSALIPDHTHTPSHTYYYCRRRDCTHIRLRRLRAETQKTYHELSSGITLVRLLGQDIYVCQL